MNKPAVSPTLRQWSKQRLADRDWDFASFCDALEKAAAEKPESESWILMYRAFTWEIDRELGSGNEPFDLTKELSGPSTRVFDSMEREFLLVQQAGPTLIKAIEPPIWLSNPQKKYQPLNEWRLCELAQHVTPTTISVSRGSNNICALEIPWTDDEDDVVDAFRSWLRVHRGRSRKVPKRPGRRHEWRTSFMNLAVYRLSAAGYTREEALKKLNGKKLSPQNFARAKRFVVQKIEGRYTSMCADAKDAAKRLPKGGYGDWRRHFLKQALPPLSTMPS